MRGQWNPRRVVAVVAGAVVGAGVRWAVLASITPGRFPWPVLMVNVAGSVVLGALLAEEPTHPAHRTLLHDAGAIGFCGAVTTFSTFAVDVVDLIRESDAGLAALYVIASVAGSIAGVTAGAAAFRRVQALTLPLEEQP